MKYALILPIVALALLAFVTPDATAEPCSAQEGDIASTRSAIDSAEAALRIAEELDRVHQAVDHFIAGNSQSGLLQCSDCANNALAISQAKTAVKTAKDAHADAVEARDDCLESHLCDGCGRSTTSGTHVRKICGGCNVTYWSCSSQAYNHRQVTCKSSRVSVNFDNGYYTTLWVTGCGAKYWVCKGTSAHRIIKSPVVRRACTSSGGSSTGGGGGGGGGGSDSGSGSGTGTGDSGSRVRCANAGPARRHCDQGGWASSAYAHYSATCNSHRRGPVTYWSCDPTARRYHARHQ